MSLADPGLVDIKPLTADHGAGPTHCPVSLLVVPTEFSFALTTRPVAHVSLLFTLNKENRGYSGPRAVLVAGLLGGGWPDALSPRPQGSRTTGGIFCA